MTNDGRRTIYRCTQGNVVARGSGAIGATISHEFGNSVVRNIGCGNTVFANFVILVVVSHRTIVAVNMISMPDIASCITNDLTEFDDGLSLGNVTCGNLVARSDVFWQGIVSPCRCRLGAEGLHKDNHIVFFMEAQHALCGII